ncbi:hypothetical protein PV341_44790 [Streptomyces sp. PA03-1a]|nr:hypothetical protein [Streptomyces sp. PA03-1a]MDX2816782.1 hypothetical protein [Streptomyces sp. PA03-5A]
MSEPSDAPQSFTTLWTNDLCRRLTRDGYTGRPLRVLFGGPHQSLPSFRLAGVRPGDRVFPLRVHRTRLHVLGRLEVARIIPYEEAADELAKLPDWSPLEGGCVSEVLVGPPGTPLDFGTTVPGELLERLTYRSRRAERRLRFVEDGRLMRSVGLQGVYRLAPGSAAELDRLVEAAAAPTAGPAEVTVSPG